MLDSAAASGTCADTEPGLEGLSDQELADFLQVAARVDKLFAGLQVAIAREVASRGDTPQGSMSFHRRHGYRQPKELLAFVFGTTVGRGEALLRLAERTAPTRRVSGEVVEPKRPALRAGLDAGALSLGQALAIDAGIPTAHRGVDRDLVSAAENALVAGAVGGAAPQGGDEDSGDRVAGLPVWLLREQASGWKQAIERDGTEPVLERLQRQRHFEARPDGHGGAHFNGYAPPLDWARLSQFIRAVSAFRSEPGESQGMATTVQDDPERPADEHLPSYRVWDRLADGRTRSQATFDALMALVDGFVQSGRAPTVAGAAPTVLVVVDGTEAPPGASVAGERATSTGFGSAAGSRGAGMASLPDTRHSVPRRWVEHLSCEGRVVPLGVDGTGAPLWMGRGQRIFNAAQRQVLAARDLGCQAPGCNFPPSFCQAHHVTEWSAGGTTDIDNAILLCTFHHSQVHRGHLRIQRSSPGRTSITGTPWTVHSTLGSAHAGQADMGHAEGSGRDRGRDGPGP